MASARSVIAQLWQDHRKMVLSVVVLAWVVVIALVQHRMGTRKDPDATLPPGTTAKIVPVGGLPVT